MNKNLISLNPVLRFKLELILKFSGGNGIHTHPKKEEVIRDKDGTIYRRTRPGGGNRWIWEMRRPGEGYWTPIPKETVLKDGTILKINGSKSSIKARQTISKENKEVNSGGSGNDLTNSENQLITETAGEGDNARTYTYKIINGVKYPILTPTDKLKEYLKSLGITTDLYTIDPYELSKLISNMQEQYTLYKPARTEYLNKTYKIPQKIDRLSSLGTLLETSLNSLEPAYMYYQSPTDSKIYNVQDFAKKVISDALKRVNNYNYDYRNYYDYPIFLRKGGLIVKALKGYKAKKGDTLKLLNSMKYLYKNF